MGGNRKFYQQILLGPLWQSLYAHRWPNQSSFDEPIKEFLQIRKLPPGPLWFKLYAREVIGATPWTVKALEDKYRLVTISATNIAVAFLFG